MTISRNQVNAVIRTYLKNTRDKLADAIPSSCNPQRTGEFTISEDAKRVLYERISKQVVEKLRSQLVRPGEEPYPLISKAC